MLGELKEGYGVQELKEEKISARNKERRAVNKAKRVAVEEALNEATEEEDMDSVFISQDNVEEILKSIYPEKESELVTKIGIEFMRLYSKTDSWNTMTRTAVNDFLDKNLDRVIGEYNARIESAMTAKGPATERLENAENFVDMASPDSREGDFESTPVMRSPLSFVEMARQPFDKLEDFVRFIDDTSLPMFESSAPSLTAKLHLGPGSIVGLAEACGRDIQDVTFSDLKYSMRNLPMLERDWTQIRKRLSDNVTRSSRFSWTVLGMPVWDGLLLRSAVLKGLFEEYPKGNITLDSPISAEDGNSERWGYTWRAALVIAIGQGNFDSPSYPKYVMQNLAKNMSKEAMSHEKVKSFITSNKGIRLNNEVWVLAKEVITEWKRIPVAVAGHAFQAFFKPRAVRSEWQEETKSLYEAAEFLCREHYTIFVPTLVDFTPPMPLISRRNEKLAAITAIASGIGREDCSGSRTWKEVFATYPGSNGMKERVYNRIPSITTDEKLAYVAIANFLRRQIAIRPEEVTVSQMCVAMEKCGDDTGKVEELLEKVRISMEKCTD